MSDTTTSATPGGDTAADGGQGGQDPTTTPTPATAATAPQTPDPQTSSDGGGDHAATIARLERELRDARAEAGKSRTNAKQRAADDARAEVTQQLLAVLDPSRAGQKATPEQLAEQLTASQAEARQTAVELAVYRNAAAAGANPDALLDSRAFLTAVEQVDPTDLDAVKQAITAAVEANPRLAAQQQPAGPPRGGVEFTGPPAGGVTPQQFAAMNYTQRTELYQSDPDTYRRLAGS